MSKVKAKKKRVVKRDTIVKRVVRTVVAVLALYVFTTLMITVNDLVDMLDQNAVARDTELGQGRYNALLDEGAPAYYNIYTDAELESDPDLEVVKLYHFPAPSGERTPFAIVLPGGGYYECDINKVGLPTAAALNDLGYSAFVLSYRYGKYSSKYAPLDDMARAVEYILDHADMFNVDASNYAVYGYSAGGNLAGLYAGEQLGYARYGLPKPSAVILAYPWININGDIPLTGNMWQEAVQGVSQLIGNNYLLGSLFPSASERDSVCVQNHVTPAYPKTYIIHGDNDFVVPLEQNSLVMKEALDKNGVENYLRIAEGVNHGCGLGIGTSAEGWIAESVRFWIN